MSSELDFSPELQSLLVALSPAERRKLAREIATELRAREQRRIAAQRNPDGTPFAPRKPRARDKKGRVRRQMFARLRTTRYMRIEATADAAVVQIAGRAARIARVHQEGGTDRVAPGGPEYRYPVRRVLGFAAGYVDMVAERIINHLAAGR
ncbi:phage virion morphogenesis protein [Thauera butanivorans]|uniref:phage virion morphogenesis protein n=1 Tax=Thauera butanivorans TaxID=86174 RepID=UPI0008383735|nr:phage virion morphogenesis protein [Thauera butanivorans]